MFVLVFLSFSTSNSVASVTLSGLSTVLDPDKRYLFANFGTGFELDANMPGGTQDGQPMRFTIPEGDTFSVVIDPESALCTLTGA